jgi:hypothetical protein
LKLRLAELAFAVVLVGLASRRALACPCSDDAGGASSLTRPGERAAVGIVASARRSQGRFDALGRYSPLGSQDSEWSEELLARAALRWLERFESSAELGFASYHFAAAGISEERAGVGDALFRTRALILEENMPHQSLRPALGFSLLLRAPLGELSRRSGQSYGSGGVQLGLGAWETGAGFDVAHGVGPWLTLGLAAEAAYRFDDHALARSRKLGPRAEASLSAALVASELLTLALSTRLRRIGDVTLDEKRLPGTAERAWTLAASALLAAPRTRLRASITAAVDPPVTFVAMGSAAAVALSVGLTYGLN